MSKVKINELYYLNKALEMAKKDQRKILNDLDVYLPHRTNANPTRDDLIKSAKMINNGYNLMKESDKLLKIEMAISDLNFTIFYKVK